MTHSPTPHTVGGFDPDRYPGWRPDGPVLVHAGRLHPLLGPHGSIMSPPGIAAPVAEPGAVRWSVAHGSNACPDRVVDKGLDQLGAVLLPAQIHGWAPAFEDRRVPSHGAVPMTLIPSEGIAQVWVLGIHRDDVASLDASEARGERYLLGQVGPVTVGGVRCARLPAYGPTEATRVLLDGDGPAWWPGRDQAWARAAHDRAGTDSMAVPAVPDPVASGWPASGTGPLGGQVT